MINNTTIPTNLDAQSVGRASSGAFVDQFATRDPTTTDINYPIQKKWLNTTDGTFWELEKFTSSIGVVSASWIKIGSVGLVETLTGNDLIAVPATNNNINVVGDGVYIRTDGNAATSTLTISPAGGLTTLYTADVGTATPSAGNLNVFGSPGASTAASGDTITITSQKTANWTVSPIAHQGDFTTITAALAAASSGDNIFVREGTYTENITGKAGVTITSLSGSSLTPTVILVGKVTYSGSGTFTISNIELRTNSDFSIVYSGSSAGILNIINCFLNCTNHTGISYTNSNASTQLYVNNCLGDLGTTGIAYWSMSSVGVLFFFECDLTNTGGSSTVSSNSAGNVFLTGCSMNPPVGSTSTGAFFSVRSNFDTSAENVTTFLINGTGTLVDSSTNSGTASAVTIGGTCAISGGRFSSSNANAITGAGSLEFTSMALSSSTTINPTLTVIPINETLGNTVTYGLNFKQSLVANITVPGAYPYTVLSTDYFISVDTGAAHTINLPNAPTADQVYIIKDGTGTANANNITITTPGGTVTIDGTTSKTINTNYGVLRVIFNGTNYLTW